MKIVAITAWAQWQPFVDGTYTCSGGRSAAGFDSTIVRIETDAGLTGWGEYAPLGSFYDPAFVGGVTKARLIRDVAVDCGLSVTIEDTGGAQIDTAAIAHLPLGVPESHRTHTVDFHHWVSVANARFDLVCAHGHMNAPSGPGLGVQVDPSAFGETILRAH